MHRSRVLIILGILIVASLLVAGGVALATPATPLAVVSHYPVGMLAEEARLMVECAECHAAADFHTCTTCHDDHGAVELERGVQFYAGINLIGDVPTPGYVLINEILPYRDQPYTHLPLRTFLERQGVTDFESLTLASNDGGFVTIPRDDLTEDALLMPYVDGIRFAAEKLHISTWLKGITRMVVVGQGTPLRIEGEATSMGRLLLGPVVEVTVEQTQVMLRSDEDGEVRRAQTAARVHGAPVAQHIANTGFQRLIVVDTEGAEYSLTAAEARGAVLAQLRGRTTLVLPDRARNQWLTDVAEIRTE